MSETAHLSAESVAAYLDRTLALGERESVEAHLADCEECRAELAAVTALRSASSRRRWLVVGIPVAAAAALVLVVLPALRDRAITPSPQLRDGAEGVEQVAVVTPAVGARVRADSVTFIWRSVAARARYHLTVTTSAGVEAWSATTGDTVLAPGRRGVGLTPGTYFWYVDGLRPDGTTATTGVQRIEVVP